MGFVPVGGGRFNWVKYGPADRQKLLGRPGMFIDLDKHIQATIIIVLCKYNRLTFNCPEKIRCLQ